MTPPGVTAWAHVSGIEASRFDGRSAYVAVERHRLDDDRPYIYVTHDAGHTWREASAGIPDGSFVNAIREDPNRRGLLYAATETGVYVSFDDGASWQSLRLNMPIVSVRDIAVHDGDLAIATHGRSFWILDDILPLRELAADSNAGQRLFKPRDAVRTRPGRDEAENSPPETPLGENPPNGAFIDYAVQPGARGPVKIEIVDAKQRAIRTWSSSDQVVPAQDPNRASYPAYWIPQPATVSTEPGMHRFVWDFHERRADGPLAPPGTYRVRATLAGRTFTQPLVLKRDPRIKVTDKDLIAQAELARDVDDEAQRIRERQRQAKGDEQAALRSYATLLSQLYRSIEGADAAPTAQERAAWKALRTHRGPGLPAGTTNSNDDD